MHDLDELTTDEFLELEKQVEKLLAVLEIQNLRGAFYRFHDDQHIGEKRRELFAEKHPSIDYEAIKKSRMDVLVDSLEGNTLIHPVTTPIIEVDDSCTKARGVFMSFGYEGLSIHREEPMAIWSIGYIPGNHVKQDGEWRVLSGVWQRTVKCNIKKGWVHDMQRSNCRPPLSEEEDRNFLGRYAYCKDECRKPVPEPPHTDTFDQFPIETDNSWQFVNVD